MLLARKKSVHKTHIHLVILWHHKLFSLMILSPLEYNWMSKWILPYTWKKIKHRYSLTNKILVTVSKVKHPDYPVEIQA